MNISRSEYHKRIIAIQQKIKAEQIDTLIVSEEEDIYYLAGLTYKSLERLFMLVLHPDKVTFILPKMELAHLKHVDHVSEIKVYWEYPAREPERWQDVLYEVTGNSGVVGVGGKSPHEISAFLQSMDVPVRKCDILEQLRWIKSDAEITKIRQAAQYCDRAVKMLYDRAYFGMTELEVFSIGSTKTIPNKAIRLTWDQLAEMAGRMAFGSRKRAV